MTKKEMWLRMHMRNKQAFDEAIRKGYIQKSEDGHLEWMLGSETLLAYFCGRLFCGDFCKYSKRKRSKVWLKGNGAFPAKDLCDLFGVKALKQLRYKRHCANVPELSELIDNLFDMG